MRFIRHPVRPWPRVQIFKTHSLYNLPFPSSNSLFLDFHFLTHYIRFQPSGGCHKPFALCEVGKAVKIRRGRAAVMDIFGSVSSLSNRWEDETSLDPSKARRPARRSRRWHCAACLSVSSSRLWDVWIDRGTRGPNRQGSDRALPVPSEIIQAASRSPHSAVAPPGMLARWRR